MIGNTHTLGRRSTWWPPLCSPTAESLPAHWSPAPSQRSTTAAPPPAAAGGGRRSCPPRLGRGGRRARAARRGARAPPARLHSPAHTAQHTQPPS
eukprot:5154500-Pyramimonas_sp.AAC.1